jgi:hypothetical protein
MAQNFNGSMKSERSSGWIVLYDNDFTSIINIYFYEMFATPNSNQ